MHQQETQYEKIDFSSTDDVLCVTGLQDIQNNL
jgi:hypothetical protein